MTKAQAYKLIEQQYGDVQWDEHTGGLCSWLKNDEMRQDFIRYWFNIGSGFKYISDPYYRFTSDTYYTLSTMARLIILNHFIEDTYK